MSLLSVVFELGVVATIFVVGFVLARRLRVDPKRRALPMWLQLLVSVVAFAPFFAQFEGLLPAVIVDDTTVALGLFVVLWIVLPVLAFKLVDAQPARQTGAC